MFNKWRHTPSYLHLAHPLARNGGIYVEPPAGPIMVPVLAMSAASDVAFVDHTYPRSVPIARLCAVVVSLVMINSGGAFDSCITIHTLAAHLSAGELSAGRCHLPATVSVECSADRDAARPKLLGDI